MKKKQVPYLRSLIRASMSFLPAGGTKPVFYTHSSDKLPAACNPYHLQGAAIAYLEYPFGAVFSQKIIVHGYIFWYHRFHITQRVVLYPLANLLLITLHYMLRGSIPCTMNGQAVILRDNHYQVYALAPKLRYTADFVPGAYESFHIALPSYILPELAPAYPDLAELIDLLKRDFKGTHYKDLFVIKTSTRICIEEILYSKKLATPEHKGKRNLYWQERAMRLINHYLEDKDLYDKKQRRLYAEGLKLSQLEDYIVENLVDIDRTSANPFWPEVLLPLLKMTKYDFKKAMLQTYYKSWEKYIYEVRMKKAMEWVQEKPYRRLTDIAYELGYSHHESFFRAFKACYHYSPGHFRKKR